MKGSVPQPADHRAGLSPLLTPGFPRWSDGWLGPRGSTEWAQIAALLAALSGAALLLLVLRFSPAETAAVAAGLGLIVTVLIYPFLGLFVFVCLISFPVNLGGFTVLQSWGLLTLAVGFTSRMLRTRHMEMGPFLVPLLSLGLVMALSIFYARTTEAIPGTLRRYAANILLYLLILAVVDTAPKLHHILSALVVGGVLNAIYGVRTAFVTRGSLERAAGFVGDANQLGYVCSFAIPIVLHRYVWARGRLPRLIYLGMAATLFGGVLSCASRGATVSLLAGLLVFVVQLRHRPWLLLSALLVLLAILPLAPEIFFRRMSKLTEDVQQSVDLRHPRTLTSRGYLHKSGFKVWKDYPLLGVGVGNFGTYFASVDYNPGWARGRTMPQHNIYLRVLVENGIVGFALFTWILWRFAAQLIKVLKVETRELSGSRRCDRDGLLAAIAVFLTMGLSLDFLFTHDLYMLLPLPYIMHRQFATLGRQVPPLGAAAFAGLERRA